MCLYAPSLWLLDMSRETVWRVSVLAYPCQFFDVEVKSPNLWCRSLRNHNFVTDVKLADGIFFCYVGVLKLGTLQSILVYVIYIKCNIFSIFYEKYCLKRNIFELLLSECM